MPKTLRDGMFWKAYRRKERMIADLDREGLNGNQIRSCKSEKDEIYSKECFQIAFEKGRLFRNELMRRNRVLV
jgi:hypothetical protein